MTQPPTPEAARLAEDLRTAYHSKTRIGHPMWQNLSEDSKGPWIAAALAALSQSRPAADEASEWTLIAPDGRRFSGESPVRCAKAELDTRVPPDVQIARIWAAVDEADMSTPAPQIDASAGCVDSSGWRPIDSAPKDGVNVLLVNRKGNMATGLWMSSNFGVGWYLRGGVGPDTFFNGHFGPTHWQPLPNPPVESTGGLAKGDAS